MRYIKEYIKWFVILNSGILLIFAFNTLNYDYIRTVYLFEIFAASAVTSIPTTILFSIEPKKEISKWVSGLLLLLHYICVLVIMLFLGNAFGWIEPKSKGVVVMALSVAGVYICATVLSVILDSREVKKLNKALEDFDKQDELENSN